ncbi:DHA2 family efflux MFS transporter permease subunit [Catenulispora pinisilvae]|uniref:DHA2 family efflux MFS transporter permease subunit n=1 Tax=Catenulispora pinisilvae TaxID=2705253 RepID=UPI001E5FCBDC|nr:DHA2 family efflux MFS transporter permease subunit [Catenulispora pinisilvae]
MTALTTTRQQATGTAAPASAATASVTTAPVAATPGAAGPATAPTTTPAAAPSAAAARRILAASVFGFFLVGLDAMVVNVALPAINRSLAGGLAGAQWVIDGYTLAFAALMLSAGALSDRIGAKATYGLGLIGFTLSSAACGVAPSLALLITARLVQGAAASLMLPASLALIRQAFPDPAKRNRAIALWTAAGSAAAAAGPVAGGLITAAVDWRWIFFLNLPAGAAALALLAGTPKLAQAGSAVRARFDVLGLLSSVVALAGLTYGFIEGGAKGFGTAPVLSSFAAAVLAAVVFAVAESRQAQPMVPLAIFKSRAMSLTAFAGFTVNAAFYGVIFLLSLYFQQVAHKSPTVTGLLFAPITAVVSVVNVTVAARMVARIGARLSMTIGLTGTAGAMLLLLAVRPDQPAWALVLLLVPVSFAGAFVVPALTIMVMGSVPAERAGTAAGIVNTSRQVGGALSVAVAGALVAGGDFAHGMHVTLIGIAVVLAVAAVAVQLLAPGRER